VGKDKDGGCKGEDGYKKLPILKTFGAIQSNVMGTGAAGSKKWGRTSNSEGRALIRSRVLEEWTAEVKFLWERAGRGDTADRRENLARSLIEGQKVGTNV